MSIESAWFSSPQPVSSVYFIEGKYMGRGTVVTNMRPHSLAYFCPTCGEVWARVIVEDDPCPHFSLFEVPCRQHAPSGVSDWGRTPGSLLNWTGAGGPKSGISKMFWNLTDESLPEEVKAWEAALPKPIRPVRPERVSVLSKAVVSAKDLLAEMEDDDAKT